MRPFLICVTALALLAVPAGAKGGGGAAFFEGWQEGSLAGAGPRAPGDGPRVRVIGPAKALVLKDLDTKGGPTCIVNTIDCNSTVTGTVQTTDCALSDGTFLDFWFFDGTAGQEVTVDLESDDFDTWLFLIDPAANSVATDNNSGTGTNSRIVFTLGTSGDWSIGANNLLEQIGDPGDYTLTLTCSGGGPTPPAAPSDLTAMTVSSTEIDLFWQDNSNDEDDFQIQFRPSGGTFQNLDTVPAGTTAVTVLDLAPATTYDFRVRARNAAGNSPWSNQASATTDPDGGGPEDCVADTTTMCLNNGRFRLEVDWRTIGGNTGPGTVVEVGTADSGLFYFFSPNNWEMLVKVLDGCDINNHFWVFAAATTDVEYTLRVTDTATGDSKQYFNPLGTASPAITDTSAFSTCP